MTSLRHKLWFGFGGLLLILLIVSTVSIIVFTRYSRALERVFRENYDSAVYVNAMKQSLDELNAHDQRLIWQESAARGNDTSGAVAQFEDSLRSQFGNIYLPGELEATQQLAFFWRDYRADEAEYAQSPSKADFYNQRLYPRYKKMKLTAQHISDMNVSSMISIDGQAKQTLVAFRNALLVLAIVGTILATLIVWTAGLSIIKPLKDLTDSAKQIEAGNLDLNLTARSRDEIGRLAEAFNAMASNLRRFKQLDQDRLVRTEQTTQMAIDSLPDAVFVIGQNGSIEISNLAAREHFRIEPGRGLAELGFKWLPELYEKVMRNRESVMPAGYDSAIQIFLDGQEHFFFPRAVPMMSQDGRQIGVTIILADITQLRRVDEAKSDLISTVSHELRTPLTSQRLMLGLLMTSLGKQLSASQQKMLQIAKADGDRLFRTIEDLLSISRIESGRMQFQYKTVGLREFVLTHIDPLRELFRDKQLDLQVEIASDLPAVQIDSVSMGSAVTNLLSNALKFTPSGGKVKVDVTAEEESVTIRVADTGTGIPPEFRPRIFEKFFRVPAADGPSGAGLGLSITRDIIKAHGGDITFVCPPEGGTVFSIRLRAAAAPASRAV